MIDTHCHIDFEDFDDDRDEVIKRAKNKLDNVIVSSYSNDSNMDVLKLSKDYEGFIYPTFGFHPVSSQNATDEEIKTAHENIIKRIDDIVAIDEVGMDYFYVTDKSLRERQQKIFTDFLELANEYKKTNCDACKRLWKKKLLILSMDMTIFPILFFIAMEVA